MIPMKVRNRLRMGRDVAAEIDARNVGCRAWVRVKPILDLESQQLKSADYGLESRVASPDSAAIIGFEVRRIELDPSFLAEPEDLDLAWSDARTTEEYQFAQTEESLYEILRSVISDLNLLRIPADVEYPWLPSKILRREL